MPHNNSKVKARAAAINRILKRLTPDPRIALKYRTPWECLVAVQLSAQCTDKKVNEVTARLFRKYRSLDAYTKATPKEFERDIYQTGFYRNKTKNILAAARMVQGEFGGKLPRTIEGMLRLPGVARKTANVVLNSVYGVVEGIAVDTHVMRLCRQWGLTKHADPVRIERDLMDILPKGEWGGWTYRVIEYGRKYSPARRTDHSGEPLEEFYVER